MNHFWKIEKQFIKHKEKNLAKTLFFLCFISFIDDFSAEKIILISPDSSTADICRFKMRNFQIKVGDTFLSRPLTQDKTTVFC
jgi:uncharacterized Fe-S cluster-containing protein